MHILQTALLFFCVAAPSVLASPEPDSDQSAPRSLSALLHRSSEAGYGSSSNRVVLARDVGSGSTSRSSNGSSSKTFSKGSSTRKTPKIKVKKPKSREGKDVPFYDLAFPNPGLGPAHLKKNCKGSGICGSVGKSCQIAALRFQDNMSYKNRTSFTHEKRSLKRCTAIYVCEDPKDYEQGITGLEIKAAFARLWTHIPGYGRRCKACGSAYLKGRSCHVTANYCRDCHDENTDQAVPVDPAKATSQSMTTAPGAKAESIANDLLGKVPFNS